MTETLKDSPDAVTPLSDGNAGVTFNGRYMAPPQDRADKIWARATALVQATPAELYALWRDIESVPKWQQMITDVISTGPNTSHWVMRADGKTIEWDSEILNDQPGRRIAWRTVTGDINEAGEVAFEPAPGGRGTIVTVLQEFRQGKVATGGQSVFSRSPKQALIENLRHFKAFAETRQIPRTEAQSHGPRDTSGSLKVSVYGEKIAVLRRIRPGG